MDALDRPDALAHAPNATQMLGGEDVLGSHRHQDRLVAAKNLAHVVVEEPALVPLGQQRVGRRIEGNVDLARAKIHDARRREDGDREHRDDHGDRMIGHET